MGLIEGWRKIAQLNLSATSVLDNNNARGFGMALASAAADLESACTPRPPKVEWFGAPVDADGKPTGKWDRWMVGRKRTRGRKSWVVWTCSTHTWMVGYWPSRETVVLPVAREGFPAPVGWHVIGGE